MKLMEINEEVLSDLVIRLAEEHIESLRLEENIYFMNSRQLQDYLGLSWPTIAKIFLGDPEFPVLKKGKHYMFHKKDLDKYLDCYHEELKHNGKDILKYRRKG